MRRGEWLRDDSSTYVQAHLLLCRLVPTGLDWYQPTARRLGTPEVELEGLFLSLHREHLEGEEDVFLRVSWDQAQDKGAE